MTEKTPHQVALDSLERKQNTIRDYVTAVTAMFLKEFLLTNR